MYIIYMVRRLVEVHDGVLHSIHLFHQPHDVIRQLPPDIDHVVGRQQERLYGSLVVDVERDVDGIAVPPQDGSLDLPHGTRGGEGQGLLESVLGLGEDDSLQQVAVGGHLHSEHGNITVTAINCSRRLAGPGGGRGKPFKVYVEKIPK